MAQVRKDVAHDIKKNCSVLSIVKAVIENEKYTKWDVVKSFLWCMWYVGKIWLCTAVVFLLRCVVILACLLTFCVSVVMLGVLAILSPVWYPVMMWLAPKHAAKFITVELYKEGDDLEWWQIAFVCPYQLAGDFIFTVILKKVWGWVWKYMPMAKRQYYLDAAGTELKTLSVAEQLQYYLLNSSAETVRKMSFEAVDELRVQYHDASDLKNIADVYEIYENLGKELFTGSGKSLELLKGCCANEKKTITGELQRFFVEQLVGERSQHAYEVLLVCAENKRPLEGETLCDLISMLGGTHGEQADAVLFTYWHRHTLSTEVVRALIGAATDAHVDEGKVRAYNLLVKVVRRDGFSTELAELFFSRCDSVEEGEMTNILKIRMDCEKVGYSYDNDENRKSWQQYCKLCKDISPDAQLMMKEWQYDIYRACGYKLDKNVLYEFLVKRIARENMSYFKKVLNEEMERETLSETGNTLMMMTPWKREIILPLLAGEKSLEYGALCFDN